MAKTVAEVRFQERSARARLAARHHPYWRSISEGRHLGYYRGRRGGSWIARCRPPDGGDYLTRSLGTADDLVDADGAEILNWRQALDTALAWFEKVEKPEYEEAAELTVKFAVEGRGDLAVERYLQALFKPPVQVSERSYFGDV